MITLPLSNAFLHELGHILGAGHSDGHGENGAYPYGHGFFIPPTNSDPNMGERTVMAYPMAGHRHRVNRFSNPRVKFGKERRPTGDPMHNNARAITEGRFAHAAVGDESVPCGEEDCRLDKFTETCKRWRDSGVCAVQTGEALVKRDCSCCSEFVMWDNGTLWNYVIDRLREGGRAGAVPQLGGVRGL